MVPVLHLVVIQMVVAVFSTFATCSFRLEYDAKLPNKVEQSVNRFDVQNQRTCTVVGLYRSSTCSNRKKMEKSFSTQSFFPISVFKPEPNVVLTVIFVLQRSLINAFES